ncbi:MAG: DNA repair protein RecO [Actinobacteria bacterium]|nr:DNA repair protein RecO [Actinomycetota bacterium]
MKDYLVDAVVLKSARTREADRVLTLYTRQVGKIRAMAHGVEKPASRKRGAVQPFSYSRLLLRRGREIDSVSQGEGVEIFPALRQNLDGLARASYIAEMVDAFTVDEDPNTGVFELLLATFDILGRGSDHIAARAFDIKLMSLVGYRPGLECCVMCGSAGGERLWFVPGQGGIVCAECGPGPGGGLEISRGSLETLKALLRWDIGRIYQIRPDPRTGREIAGVMKRFVEYQLEKSIKSARFVELLEKGFSF